MDLNRTSKSVSELVRILRLNSTDSQLILASPKSLELLTYPERGEYEVILNIPTQLKKVQQLKMLYLYLLVTDSDMLATFRLQALDLCYKNQYNKGWIQLHALLQYNTVELCLYKLLERYSFRALQSQINNFIKDFKVHLTSNRRAPQKSRLCWRIMTESPCIEPRRIGVGYRDKGSVRKNHEPGNLAVHSGPNPEKLDLRHSVKRKNSLLHFLYG